jgi:hypothetical protein
MNQIGKIAVLILLLSLSIGAKEQIAVKEYPLTDMQKQNRTIVKMASIELSKSLPQKIDPYTTLIKIEGKEEVLLYHFEINTGMKSDETVKNEDRKRMQHAVTNGICNSSQRFLEAGIKISYLYFSARSKAELFRFNVSKTDCFYGK